MSRPRLTPDETDEHSRRLVEATFRVVATTGDANPSIRPILDEAGLSRQVFYRCFASKDALIGAVLAEGSRLLLEHLSARMAKAATPEAKVHAMDRRHDASGGGAARSRTHTTIHRVPARGRGPERRGARGVRARAVPTPRGRVDGRRRRGGVGRDGSGDRRPAYPRSRHGKPAPSPAEPAGPDAGHDQALGDFVLRGIGATTPAPIVADGDAPTR